MLSLRLFGGLDLTGPDGPVSGRAAQRRRLALLAVLAVARGRPVTRDKLVALLWPDADSERARHGLADSLYVLRDALGEDVILATGDVLSLNTDRISCDVVEFERAIEAAERERAARLYEAGGAFLDGVHLTDAGELERWIESVRDRLATSYRETLEALAKESSARGDLAGAVRWRRKLAAEDRLSSRVALELMRALAAAGDRAGALEFARVHESLVRAELESEPDAAVVAFAEELRTPSTRPATAAPANASSPRSRAPVSADDGDAQVAHRLAAASTSAIARQAGTTPRRARWLAALVLVVALAIYGVLRTRQSSASPAPNGPSIAVLPLSNVGGDPKNESFVDGMTEELTTALAGIDGLQVAANTWAMAFKGARTDIRRIADTLRVSYLLEGGLQLADGRIHLNLRLIEATSGSTRWSKNYDATLTDAFAIQDSIGRSVAKALEIRLIGDPSRHLARHMTSDPVAYELYLRGHRDATLLRTDSGLRAGVSFFSQAIERDSSFAAAYAGLAHMYNSLARIGRSTPRPVLIDSAYAAARKAVSLDDSLAEAHTFLAFSEMGKQDLRAASMEVNRALELDPHDLFARTFLGVLYNWAGKHEKAVLEFRRAMDADPSPLHQADLAHGLFFAGHDDEALAALKPLREVRPPINRMARITSEIYLHKQMWKEALDEIGASTDSAAPSRAALGMALGRSGDRVGAMKVLQELKQRQQIGKAGAFEVATVYLGLGDNDQALVWLDMALDDHSVTYIVMDPTFASLHKDPRFQPIRERLGVDAIQFK